MSNMVGIFLVIVVASLMKIVSAYNNKKINSEKRRCFNAKTIRTLRSMGLWGDEEAQEYRNLNSETERAWFLAQFVHDQDSQTQQMVQDILRQAQADAFMQQQFMQMQQQSFEEMQRMATGIEFGGYNPDTNLNPGMQMNMFHDMNSGMGTF